MICLSVTKVESLDNMDVLTVGFDDGSLAYWFYSEAEALKYVGKEVIVTMRNDFYKGNVVPTINTFVEPSRVNTLERHESLRLYCEQEDNLSNLSFNEIAEGETKAGCIFYCVKQEIKTSDKSTWCEYLIRDKCLRIATLRLFYGENPTENMAGQYCMANLTRSKYGMQTHLIAPANGEYPRNPEIDIAKQFIIDYFVDDKAATDYMNALNYLNKLENVIDYEQGYILVRLAMELSMCESLYNITNMLDIKLIEHALLISYTHHCTEMTFSDEVCNVIMAIRYKWPSVVKLVSMIDPGNVENRPDEYDVMRRIKETVDTIIRKKKEY